MAKKTKKVNKPISRVKSFTKPNSQQYINAGIIILLIAVSMFYAYSTRDASKDLEVTDQWAANNFNSQLRAQATAVVNQQYPNLPAAQAEERIGIEIQNLRSQLGDTYTGQVAEAGQSFRDRLQQGMPDGSSQTYLLAIDPYYHLWRTQNYVDNGHAGDEIKDGTPWLTLMWAPIGTEAIVEFHNVIGAFVHKINQIFNPQAELIQSFFWLPVIFSMLAVIPAFFIAYRRTNYLGGFIAAMITAVHPYVITRTAAGFSDTDAYNIFFPLLITWLVLEAFQARRILMKSILGTLAGLAVGFFSFAWVGWWYIFDFIIIGMATYMWYLALKKLISERWPIWRKVAYYLGGMVLAPIVAFYFLYLFYLESDFKNKFKKANPIYMNAILVPLIFFVASFIFVTLFQSTSAFMSAFIRPLGFSTIQTATGASLWPNVFTTVAELNRSNISQIVNNI
jgi:asparagine N-glycosylation enzyme membrane subunit Stt3